MHQNAAFSMQNLKKFPRGLYPQTPMAGGVPPPYTLPHTASPWAGALRAPGSPVTKGGAHLRVLHKGPLQASYATE